MLAKMKRGKRTYVFKSYKEQPDEEITLDYVMDHCVIAGSVNKVVDSLLALREETGDFGEIVYAGMDWVDPAIAKRSMRLDGRRGDAAGQRRDRQGGGGVRRLAVTAPSAPVQHQRMAGDRNGGGACEVNHCGNDLPQALQRDLQ